VHKEGEEIHVSPEEASAGDKPHIVRYVLAASLILVVIVFAIVGLSSADMG
jgi:hypothetical protein